jgi:hypothetical protein
MKSKAFSWPSLIAILDDSLCSSAEYIFLVRRDEERRGWEKENVLTTCTKWRVCNSRVTKKFKLFGMSDAGPSASITSFSLA